MKKILALLTVLVVAFSLSVPAMAKEVVSPSAPTYYTVTYYGVEGIADGTTAKVKENSTVNFNAKSGNDAFVKWNISGKYTTVNGSLNEPAMTVKVNSDLIITGVYQSNATSNDPNSNGGYDIRIIGGIGENPDGDNSAKWIGGRAFITYDAVRNELDAVADPSKGSFDGWGIYVVTYTPDGKPIYTPAVAGKDYKIVVDGVALSDEELNKRLPELLAQNKIRIIPLTDLVICGNYDGKITSPKTFDYLPFVMMLALLSLGGIVLVSKKVLQK